MICCPALCPQATCEAMQSVMTMEAEARRMLRTRRPAPDAQLHQGISQSTTQGQPALPGTGEFDRHMKCTIAQCTLQVPNGQVIAVRRVLHQRLRCAERADVM